MPDQSVIPYWLQQSNPAEFNRIVALLSNVEKQSHAALNTVDNQQQNPQGGYGGNSLAPLGYTDIEETTETNNFSVGDTYATNPSTGPVTAIDQSYTPQQEQNDQPILVLDKVVSNASDSADDTDPPTNLDIALDILQPFLNTPIYSPPVYPPNEQDDNSVLVLPPFKVTGSTYDTYNTSPGSTYVSSPASTYVSTYPASTYDDTPETSPETSPETGKSGGGGGGAKSGGGGGGSKSSGGNQKQAPKKPATNPLAKLLNSLAGNTPRAVVPTVRNIAPAPRANSIVPTAKRKVANNSTDISFTPLLVGGGILAVILVIILIKK